MMLYPIPAIAVCVVVFTSVLLTVAAGTAATKKRRMPYLREEDLANYLSSPTMAGGAGESNTNKNNNNEKTKTNTVVGDWMSLSETVEFMPNTNLPPIPNNKNKIPSHLRPPSRPSPRHLDQNYHYEASSNGAEEPTTGAWDETDPYSIQPFVEGLGDYDEYQQAWRLLGFMIDCNTVTDDDASGSGSEETTEDGCTRYVLWAAVRHNNVLL